MTEPKPDAFDISSSHVNPTHDLDVRLLGHTLLAVTEPEA
jgi:hypothetical protein